MRCQVRMPDVDDKDKPHRGTVVPDLVLERVVKYYKLSFDPLAGLTGNSDPRPGWHHEAKVGADPAVSWTSMRPDVSNWMHYRKFYLQTIIINTSRVRPPNGGRNEANSW